MPARWGAEYVAGLQDGRDVWYQGKSVEDITAHPTFAPGLRIMAQLYDLQHHPAHQQTMTYPSPQTAEPVGQSFRMPRGVEDLVVRRSMLDLWASTTGGMLIPSPDYANIGLMALASARNVLATVEPRFGVHALRYYEQAREQDWCVAHVPAVAMSQSPGSPVHKAPGFRVTASRSEGLRVSGICQSAPLVPVAHELLVCGGAALKSGQGQHALAFALPVATQGVSIICKEAYHHDKTAHHPSAARWGTPDCVLLFDEVLVPWERVFLSGNIDLHNRLMIATGFAAQVGHQVLTRQVAKTMLLLGIAEQLSQAMGMTEHLHVQAKLGELITTLEAMRSCLRRAEVDATAGPGGVWVPDGHAIRAGQRLFAGCHPRIVEMLQILGARDTMMSPSDVDLEGPLSELMAQYTQGNGGPTDAPIQLFRLAWALAGDPFGARRQLYEPDIPADLIHAMASDYQGYDLQAVVARAGTFLETTIE